MITIDKELNINIVLVFNICYHLNNPVKMFGLVHVLSMSSSGWLYASH